MINSSKETQSIDKIDVEPFRLSTDTENQPSFFEIVFLLDSQQYRYGFQATDDRIITEWLYYVPKSRETLLFKRDNDNINISNKKYDADDIKSKTRHNALFLSVSAQFNVNIAEKILNWLTNQVKVVSGADDRGYLGYTVQCLSENRNKHEILQLIKQLDFGINDIQVEAFELTIDSLPNDIPDELKKLILKNNSKGTLIRTAHRKFDREGNSSTQEFFDLDSHESEGTRKVFALAAPLIDTLKNGKVFIIDEMDARLHPLISSEIVKLFNSNETNPHNAQLIFMTHDTNLLSNKLFRRDQIWFTEKNKYGATDLYSLAEYKVRNDASFESDYIKGRYGAIPYIGNLTQILDSHD